MTPWLFLGCCLLLCKANYSLADEGKYKEGCRRLNKGNTVKRVSFKLAFLEPIQIFSQRRKSPCNIRILSKNAISTFPKLIIESISK